MIKMLSKLLFLTKLFSTHVAYAQKQQANCPNKEVITQLELSDKILNGFLDSRWHEYGTITKNKGKIHEFLSIHNLPSKYFTEGEFFIDEKQKFSRVQTFAKTVTFIFCSLASFFEPFLWPIWHHCGC